MKQWHFYEKVYRRWLVLFIGRFEDFQAEMRTLGFDETENLRDARGMCIELRPSNNTSNQNCVVMWLSEWHLSDLVHEIAHLVTFCFDEVGVPITRDNTEAHAFYLEYWFSRISNKRRRFPNGNKPKDAQA